MSAATMPVSSSRTPRLLKMDTYSASVRYELFALRHASKPNDSAPATSPPLLRACTHLILSPFMFRNTSHRLAHSTSLSSHATSYVQMT